MYNYDAINTLADINTIPRVCLDKLGVVLEGVICNAVYEAKLVGETEVACDVGIGAIHVSWDADDIHCSFSPRQRMTGKIRKTVVEGKNDLMISLEDSLTKRIINKYKELI